MAKRIELGDGLRPIEDDYEDDYDYHVMPHARHRASGRDRRRTRRLARRRRPLYRRPVLRVVLALLLALVLVTGWSLSHALTAPGGGTFSERVAEWARNHYLGPLVTLGEWITYQAPKTGGKPSMNLAQGLSATPVACSSRRRTRNRTVVHRACRKSAIPGSRELALAGLTGPLVPRRLTSPAGRPLRGEGTWRVLGSVHGVPAIYGTYLRPDSVHTSYVAGLVWMDQQLLKFQLRPGMEDPGPANWGAQATIPPGHRRGLLATFNGGFKIANAQGGFYLNGITRGALEPGAASMVYYRNGQLKIGIWDRGVRMGPDVVGVRQNLRPVVENGRVPASVDTSVLTTWGATLGGGYYVWRSGIGITRDGRIVYVYGPALNVRDLADLLRRAGCVTAMELDINPDWMSFMYYLPKHHPGDPTPVNLLPGQMQPADRYYYLANRDFTAVFAR